MERFQRRGMFLAAILVLVLGLAVACGGDEEEAAPETPPAAETGETAGGTGAATPEPATPSGEPIKIGAPVDLSGGFAIYGEQMKQATDLALEEINAAGGILSRPVEAIYADTASDVQPAVDQVKKLLQQDNADAIIGIISSAARDAIIPTIARAKKVFLYPTTYEGGTAANFEGKGAEYTFTTGPVSEQYVKPLNTYLVETLGKKSVYILAMDYIYGTGSADAATEAIEAAGGEVVDTELVPLGTTDFSAILNRIDRASPDAVYAVVAGEDLVFLMKQFQEFGLKEKDITFATTELDESYFSGLAPAVLDGTVVSLPYYIVLDTPENAAFLEAWRAKYGEDSLPGLAAESMYYTVKLFAAAAESAGSLETDALVTALEDAEVQAPQGTVSIRKEDHQALMGDAIAVIEPDESVTPYQWVKIQEVHDRIEPKLQGNLYD